MLQITCRMGPVWGTVGSGLPTPPTPPEQPDEDAKDGESRRPGPGAVGRRPLLVQLLRQPGAVGGGFGQLHHEGRHPLFQQLKRKKFFFTLRL